MKGKKTLIVSALVALAGWLATPEVAAWAAEHAEWVSTALGVVIAGLRVVTTGPVLKGE